METEVDNYRGWAITFDTSEETFTAYSNAHDSEVKKQSYAATKKYIDDFMKDNQNFKPFDIVGKPTSYRANEKLRITGIRKDGRFVAQNSKGQMLQVSTYDEEKYLICYPEFDAEKAEYLRMDALANTHRRAAEDYAKERFEKNTLVEFKKQLIS